MRISKRKRCDFVVKSLMGIFRAWPDPLPIRYARKGLGTNVGFSRVVYSEEGVGLVKSKRP